MKKLLVRKRYIHRYLIMKNSLLAYVGSFGLPTEGILVPIAERKSVIRNFEDVVDLLRQEDISGAVYISKFITAASSGLFDAA